ncbi:MAG: hypothetical protein ACRBCL_08250 [Maritimibacter sp.]
MSKRTEPKECKNCGQATLPPIAFFDETPRRKWPKEFVCGNCGTAHELRKWHLAFQQTDRSFWDAYVSPNMAAVVLSLGLGLIFLYIYYLFEKAFTRLTNKLFDTSIYKKL